jgi:hypothetical protein
MHKTARILWLAGFLSVAGAYPTLAEGAFGVTPEKILDAQKIQDFQTQGSPEISPNITTVAIVDLEELPPPMQQQVEDQVQNTSEEDLQALRDSIDQTPQVSSELRDRGISTAQVIAINLDSDGVLTLIVNTEA